MAQDTALAVINTVSQILIACGAAGIFLQLAKNRGALQIRRTEELTEFRKSLMTELDQVKAEAKRELDQLRGENRRLEQELRRQGNKLHELGIDFASYRASVRQMVMMMRHNDPRWEDLSDVLINATHDVDKLILGQQEKPALATRRILVVDDSEDVLSVMQAHLASWGYDVKTASSGPAGIDTFVKSDALGEGFDLLITDLAMPGMSGEQVATTIRNYSPETPIAFLTGHAEDMSPEWSDRIGNCEIWAKPIGPEFLRGRLEALLGRA